MSNDPQYEDNTSKNLKELKAQRPKSARLIQEDGTMINLADAVVDEGGGVFSIRAITE